MQKKTKAERVLDLAIERLLEKGHISREEDSHEAIKRLMLGNRITPAHFIRMRDFGKKGVWEIAGFLGLEECCGRFIVAGTEESSGILPLTVLCD